MRRSVCYALIRAYDTIATGAIVFAAAVAALVLWEGAMSAVVNHLPASHWMEVRRFDVHDAVEGEQPAIDYGRVFHRPFMGRYLPTIWSVTRQRMECDAESGWIRYRSGAHESRVDLAWFMGKDCRLAPGYYTITPAWEIIVLGDHTLKYTAPTTGFTIRPRSP